MSKRIKRCLADGCSEEQYIRGLCNRHYMAAHRLVKAGEVTWEQLESEGLASPSRRTGARTAFGKKIEKIAGEKK